MSFKKLILVGAIVGVGVFALRGTKMFGHAKQEVTSLVEWAESSLVTPEKEIARLRKEVSALDKDIRNVGAALAKETVEVKYLREDSGKMKGQVATDHDKINARGDAISAATEKVSYNGGRTISVTDAKVQLDAEAKRLVSKKRALDAMEKSLAAREDVKIALEQQLEEFKKKKIELTAEIDTVEAEFNMLKYKQMQSKYSFDSSRLSKIKVSLQDLRKKHDIAVVEMNLEPLIRSEDPAVETLTVEEILSQLNDEKVSNGKVSKK